MSIGAICSSLPLVGEDRRQFVDDRSRLERERTTGLACGERLSVKWICFGLFMNSSSWSWVSTVAKWKKKLSLLVRLGLKLIEIPYISKIGPSERLGSSVKSYVIWHRSFVIFVLCSLSFVLVVLCLTLGSSSLFFVFCSCCGLVQVVFGVYC